MYAKLFFPVSFIGKKSSYFFCVSLVGEGGDFYHRLL